MSAASSGKASSMRCCSEPVPKFQLAGDSVVGELRSQITPSESPRSDMVWIPGGTFRMGSDEHYAEEAPVHRVTVDAFWIDRTPVTNRQFREFVRATGHITFAEIPPDAEDYPGALPHMLKAGSLVFNPPKRPIDDLGDWSQWWNFKFGANWRRPYGPRSSLAGLNAFAWPTVTRWLMRNGRARTCRPKPSGSLLRAVRSRRWSDRSPGSDSAGDHWFVATPVQSSGLAQLLGRPSTNQRNTLQGGLNVFMSPAKSNR